MECHFPVNKEPLSSAVIDPPGLEQMWRLRTPARYTGDETHLQRLRSALPDRRGLCEIEESMQSDRSGY